MSLGPQVCFFLFHFHLLTNLLGINFNYWQQQMENTREQHYNNEMTANWEQQQQRNGTPPTPSLMSHCSWGGLCME
jgi:hypothetical protein